jgi:hypothetical protein
VRPAAIGLLVASLLVLGACGGQGAAIDWVDFIQWKGITFLAVPPASAGTTTPVLGAQLATTKRQLADNETNPAYRIKDGDTGYLKAGTLIYALRDYRSSFRIGVKGTSGTVMYEADTNPNAATGADLLDLENKVIGIGIDGPDSTAELASIQDPAAITRLVRITLQAPVGEAIQPAGTQYFVAFHFRDGTESVRAFWPSMGLLQRGIIAGPEFARIILSALPSPAA